MLSELAPDHGLVLQGLHIVMVNFVFTCPATDA